MFFGGIIGHPGSQLIQEENAVILYGVQESTAHKTHSIEALGGNEALQLYYTFELLCIFSIGGAYCEALFFHAADQRRYCCVVYSSMNQVPQVRPHKGPG